MMFSFNFSIHQCNCCDLPGRVYLPFKRRNGTATPKQVFQQTHSFIIDNVGCRMPLRGCNISPYTSRKSFALISEESMSQAFTEICPENMAYSDMR